jgi:hypothetical protein
LKSAAAITMSAADILLDRIHPKGSEVFCAEKNKARGASSATGLDETKSG